MKVLLTYRNSKLDNQHEFGLMLTDGNEVQYRWLWFYLGQQLTTNYRDYFELFPYSVLYLHSDVQKGKVLKEYSQNDVLRLALLIINRINKQLKK